MTTHGTVFSQFAAGISLALFMGLTGAPVAAQEAPPSHVASPEVYKLLAENDQWRVVRATWQPGQKDNPHMHEADRVSIFETDCQLKLTGANGKSRVAQPKAGKSVARTGKPVKSHWAENVGDKVCSIVIVEMKK